jgi:hypothetical protein
MFNLFFRPLAFKACPFYVKSDSVSRDKFQNNFLPKNSAKTATILHDEAWKIILNLACDREIKSRLPASRGIA